MRTLRDYGAGIGASLLILGFIVNTLVPERPAYSLSVAGFGMLLLVAGLIADRRRVKAFFGGRRGRAAGASFGYLMTVVAVIVLVNFLAGRHHKRWDLTENKAFSLSEQTIKVLESLPRDVSLTAFYQETEPTRQKLEDLLAEYRYRTDRLKVRFIDPDKNPGEVRRYEVTEYNTIVLESGARDARVNSADEESITNALIKVVKDRERVVYFTTGHGERDIADGEREGLAILKEELEKQHYTPRALVLNRGVPADASLVVIARAEKTLLEGEVAIIRDYLEDGGRLFLLLDPGTDPGLAEILAEYGGAVREDIVIDKVTQLFGGDARIPMVPADGYDPAHAVTKTFSYQTIYPLASSIELADDPPDGVVTTALAQTSDFSWGETNREEMESGSIQLDEGVDVPGPMTIGAALVRSLPDAAEGSTDGSEDQSPEGSGDSEVQMEQEESPDEAETAPRAKAETRVLLFGDSDFLSNAYFNASGNGDLALSGIAWLAEQEELVSIRPKISTPSIVILTPQQVFFYFWTIVALAPLAITVVGVGIWVRRKKL